MATCPKCQTNLGEQDFGLIQCPSCAASLMIDLDGSVAAHTDEAPPPPPVSKVNDEHISDQTGSSLSDQLLDDLVDEDPSVGGEADRMLSDPDNWSTDGVKEGPLADEVPEGLDKSFATGEIPSIGEVTSGYEDVARELDEQEASEADDFDGLIGDVEDELNEGLDPSILGEDSVVDHEIDSSPELADQPVNHEDSSIQPSGDENYNEFEDLEPLDGQNDYRSEGSGEGYGEDQESYEEDKGSAEMESNTLVNVSTEHYDGQYEQGEEVYSPADSEASVDEIAEYGNSPASQSGTITYSLTIGSIDSRELRDEIKEIFSDKRLMLNVEELMQSITNGEVQVEGISSLKTFVLVSQLVGLPVTLNWRQHVQAHA